MYEIDSVETTDWVQISLDSQSFTTFPRLFYSVTLPSICGASYYVETPNDRLFIKIPHSAGSLTLKFIMKNNQASTDESWGFKDIRVLFASTSATISPTMCMISPSLATPAYACPCQEGYYYVLGACQKCDLACSSCFGSTAETCYQCATGYGFDGTECVKCDASCSTCRGPTANECNSCPSGKALLNGESCQDSSICVSPYSAQTDVCSGTYCTNLCYPSKYLMPDGSCRATCEAPLREKIDTVGKHCLMPCESSLEYYYEENGKCSFECETWVSMPEGLYLVCHPPPHSISRLLHYVRYLNIEMPDRLQNLTLRRENNILSLRVAPKMFKKVRQGFVKIPGYFSINPNLPTSFFVNFSDDLILLGIILTFGLGFLALEGLFKLIEISQAEYIFERLRVFTLCNLPIMLVLVNTGDIIFFSVLEFRTYHYEYPKAAFSLAMGIIMFIIMIGLLIAIIALSFFAYSIKAEGPMDAISKEYEAFASKWQMVQVLFRGFKGTNLFYQAFYCFYCFRIALPMIFSAGMENSPLAQIILDLCLNILMVIYLLYARPLKAMVDLVNLVLLESIFFVANVSCLVLTILSLNNSDAQVARTVFGDFILGCDIAIQVLAVGTMCVKLWLTAREAKAERLKKTGNHRAIWLQMLFIPIQQGCFGFEQIQIDRFSGEQGARNKRIEENQKLNRVADTSSLQDMFRNSSMNFRGTEESDFGQASSAFPIHKISDKALMERTMMTEREYPPSNLNISVGQNSSQFLRAPARGPPQIKIQRSVRGLSERNDTFYQTDASLFDQPNSMERTERSRFL